MKLYGFGQSRSFRALWGLEESGLDYEYQSVTFGSSDANGTSSDDYTTLNFQGKVPTLVDSDLIITESGAILNYIASSSQNKLLIPHDDIRLRAKYDEMCCFVLTELEQALWTNGKHSFALPKAQRIPEVLNTATWEFNKAIKTLQHLFNGQGFVLGDNFSMADILLAQTLNWAHRFKFKVPDKFTHYKERMYARSACVRAIDVLNNNN